MKRIKKNLIADFTFENNIIIATQSKEQSKFVRTLRSYSIYDYNAVILKYQNVRVFLRGILIMMAQICYFCKARSYNFFNSKSV